MRDHGEVVERFLDELRGGRLSSVSAWITSNGVDDSVAATLETVVLLEGAVGELDDLPAPPELPGFTWLDDTPAGAGGMGTVWRAREESLGRTVAVKIPHARLDETAGRHSLDGEARAAASLEHANIVRVHRLEVDGPRPYYVMEWVDGVPLDEACLALGPESVARVFEKVARAVAAAHRAGVVHRDLKPSNILVDRAGEPRITDFGLAGALVEEGGAVRGTPPYMAPEVWRGEEVVTAAADIYALGATLFTVLTRVPPSPVVSGEDPGLPSAIDPDVAEGLQRICLKAMEPRAEDRYASAAHMADDLARFRAGRSVAARPSRYAADRGARLLEHLGELESWRGHGLVDDRELDSLVRPYHNLLDHDSPWDELARRFPKETVVLRLGGWLMLISSLLWPAFYWARLSGTERVLAVGIPCALLNAVGWTCRARRSRLNAAVFLSTGCLLLPVFIAVLLTEAGWWRAVASDGVEWYGPEALGPSGGFAPTNVQLLAAAGAFLAYSGLLLGVLRLRLLAGFVGAAVWISWFFALSMFGLKEWLFDDRVARALCWFVPAAILLAGVAAVMRRSGREAWASTVHPFFALPLVALMTGIARFGADEWLGAGNDWDTRTAQGWLMVNGAVYLGVARLHGGSSSPHVRFWGEAFASLVPLSLLVPTNVLFERAPHGGTLGGETWGVWALASGAISLALAVVGTMTRRRMVAAGGLVGLAVFLMRVTDRHFDDVLAWPLALAALAAGAMAVAVAVTWWRARR